MNLVKLLLSEEIRWRRRWSRFCYFKFFFSLYSFSHWTEALFLLFALIISKKLTKLFTVTVYCLAVSNHGICLRTMVIDEQNCVHIVLELIATIQYWWIVFIFQDVFSPITGEKELFIISICLCFSVGCCLRVIHPHAHRGKAEDSLAKMSQ